LKKKREKGGGQKQWELELKGGEIFKGERESRGAGIA
jgi:hypothetical protein